MHYFLRKPWQIPIAIITKLPFFSFIRKTNNYQNPISFKFWFKQKVLGIGGNKLVYWPVHPTSQVFDWENIYAGIDSCPGIMKGCYIQGKGGITIGDYTQIAPNVIIVSANHDIYDSRKHIPKRVSIGKYSWIGAGAKIMPGVRLGDFTIVGAGAVVTKSFEDGHCIIGGNPAQIIKNLDKEKCVRYEHPHKYYGYLSEDKFRRLKEKHPNISQ
ncbi:acyltransferase [Carboxylicivirga sp. N1Y90]|uniref:acyltransferase n=1 Tax=Carboxylicivirga fragile TaxID=3417571 RepID=UPI003D33CB3C|nr:acyltransferase [Marinilabiliaceae bacterium N1Y90]